MSKTVIMAGWDDAPHLSPETKAEYLAAVPPYMRDARTKGIPMLGSGAIYPVPEGDVLIDPIQLEPWWPRCFALDVGWNRTATIWGAHDLDTDVVYLDSEHYRALAEPSVHASSIRARGSWIPGVIDPAARGRSQADGQQLIKIYQDLGLLLSPADNAVEAGIYAMWERLSQGRLKVFRSCANWLAEFRLYRRNDKGQIVKVNDHLMDACLHGDTLVFTKNGKKKIKDLVGVDGYVLSREGVWARYTGARLTIKDSPLVRLFFDDGSEVVCTPDHPFLTLNGWIKAIDMNGLMCYNGISQRNTWEIPIWTRLLSATQFKNFLGNDITSVVNISKEKVLGFIDWCGQLITIGLIRLKDIASTISMVISQIIDSKILNLWINPTICHTTIQGILGGSLKTLWIRLHCGTPLKKVLNGTISIILNAQKTYIEKNIWNVLFVGNTIRHKLAHILNFARTIVNQHSAGKAVLTMKNVIAWFAAKTLLSINIIIRNHAQKNVVLNCLNVKEEGIGDVYCLTVPGLSSFCLANGAVVHNTRYLIMSGLKIAVLAPKAPEQTALRLNIRAQPLHQADYNPFSRERLRS